jgi:hypothetical protein
LLEFTKLVLEIVDSAANATSDEASFAKPSWGEFAILIGWFIVTVSTGADVAIGCARTILEGSSSVSGSANLKDKAGIAAATRWGSACINLVGSAECVCTGFSKIFGCVRAATASSVHAAATTSAAAVSSALCRTPTAVNEEIGAILRKSGLLLLLLEVDNS